MRVSIVAMWVILASCNSQDHYQNLLRIRVTEIENEEIFDNSAVVYDESTGFGTTLPIWEMNQQYYNGDIVWSENNLYELLADSSIGQNPDYSSKDWRSIPGKRPYLFLRDTAKVEDLEKLLTSKHPYVKTYAFGALSHRRSEGLFEVILTNLSDTTRMSQLTSDFGFDVCPADLMISYQLEYLTKEQIDELKHLIREKYQYLTHAQELLEAK